MKTLKNIGGCLWLVMIVNFPAHAQKLPVDTLVKRFEHYRDHAFQEKIYAHLDRNFYLTGETLWFKTYIVDASFHQPSDVSKVAYAEILDKADFPVLQAKIEVKEGLGSGSFFLPASLSSGNYRFRVYTNWMKNFSADFYYGQTITIVNPFVIPESIRPAQAGSCHVDFFPEGGHLVTGIRSKVAFKISEPSGKSTSCSGAVLNNRGDTIASLTPDKAGLGYFFVSPSHDEKYRVILGNTAVDNKQHAFPEVNDAGYVMHLLDSGEFLKVFVTAKGVHDRNVFLFAHARQIIARAESQPLRNNKAAFLLSKADLADGISHFTIFNEDLQPVCERLYFIYPKKTLDIEITSNQKVFAPRRKVVLSLQTKIDNGQGRPAELSMSVYKVDSLSTPNAMSIYPYLWLGSDLAGPIQSPEYYLDRSQPKAVAAIDNLMLTQGWRRFDWKDILDKKSAFEFLPEVRGHIVSGIVTRGTEKQRGIFTYLGSPGKIIRAYGSWSNDSGEVRFEIKDFYGPRRIILQTKTDTSDVYGIKIIDPFSPARRAEKLPTFRLDERFADAVLSRSIAMQVQDIFYYDQFGDQFVSPTVDSSAFYGKADATYLLDDYTRFPVMEEVMREYVPGVFVRKRKDGFHFIVVDQVRGGVLQGDPMVLLDGVPILDVDDIMAMDPLRVKKLEVIKRSYYLGQAIFSGIVSYTTYHGDLAGMEMDPRGISLNYDGLQMKRQFHKPQYSREQLNDRMPDQRYVLHWDPEITTDQEGKSQVEFFTSDVPGKYIVVVEGLTATGHSGTRTITFTITDPDNQ
jgi:hypothetical protein